MNKEQFLNLIKSHIEQFGYHITIVAGNSPLPKYCYTIGICERSEFELAFVGGGLFKTDEIKLIIDTIFEKLNAEIIDVNEIFKIENLGTFKLCQIDQSWSSLMFDGIFDYYKKNVPVYQIMPDDDHETLEIPDMSKEFLVHNEPVWQYLVNEWNWPVDQNAIAYTDLDALFGKPILELMRWEPLEWEMFSSDGTKIPTDKKRAISIGTMIGIDPTLEKVLYLELEKGLWREDENSEWNDWG